MRDNADAASAFRCRTVRRGLWLTSFWMLAVLWAGCITEADPSAEVVPDTPVMGVDVVNTDTAWDSGAESSDGPVTLPARSPVLEDPGRVTWRRLSAFEYNNTVRDLLGTRQRPADDFPADDLGYGFDNIANVLSVSPLHLEFYERAAEALSREAIEVPLAGPIVTRVEAEDYGAEVGGLWQDHAWNLWSDGVIKLVMQAPVAGEYEIKVGAFAQQAGTDYARMRVSIDGRLIDTFAVAASGPSSQVYKGTMELHAGNHELWIEFINDYVPEGSGGDRNLIVDWAELRGPLDLPDPVSSPRNLLYTCDPAEIGAEQCAREILTTFVSRAWRRPVTTLELNRLLAFFQIAHAHGLDFDEGLRLAIKAVLLAPQFLYKVELDPPEAAPDGHLLSHYEIATRLSYFLWSSMPDEQLFAAAEAEKLHDTQEIAAQVVRMLKDERAMALVDSFAAQWLYIRDIDNAFPERWIFPHFDEPLRDAMREELRHFVSSILLEERSMLELLTADFTFVNERLASHYGIGDVSGSDFVRVDVGANPRRGLLTKAGLLMVLSSPFRTSIVRRGKWVLGQLLCSEPPSPPPGVEGLLDDSAQSDQAMTLREKMALHISDPSCVACHEQMDPIGFGLENYDGVGAWRTTDSGQLIDASGTLPDGSDFIGAHQLQTLIAEDPRFAACVAEKLFVYGLGRGLRHEDELVHETIVQSFVDGGFRFVDLLIMVATSDPFLRRRIDIEEGAP